MELKQNLLVIKLKKYVRQKSYKNLRIEKNPLGIRRLNNK